MIFTTKGLTIVTSFTGARKLAWGERVAGLRMRSIVYFTSEASTVLPSENVASRRSVNV